MKKYISSLLIVCLLNLFSGCYSTKEVTIEEIPFYDNLIITTKDSAVYNLNRNINEDDILQNTNVYFSDDWVIHLNKSVINLITQKAVKDNLLKDWQIKKDTTTIEFQDISNISAEYVDSMTILLVIGVIAIGLAIVVLAIWAGSPHWKIHLPDENG